MADGVQELLVRVRADTADALAGMNKVSAGLQAAVAQATKAGASFNDLTAASRAVSAAFGQARTDEARAQFARLAAEVAETQAAMLSAATAAPTLADRLDEAVRAVYQAEASLDDVAQAARLADQALRSASTDDARSEYAFLAAELERVREGMVALAQVGTQGGPSPAALQALVGAAQGASASLDDVARAQQAVDAAFRASRTDEERAEYAALGAQLRETRASMLGTGAAGQQMGSHVGGANLALQGMARFANDAQQFNYGLQQGLIAVSNQSDQLVYAWSRMKAEAAATGTTLRSQLLGAITGPNGILLGINLVATAAVVLGPKLAEAFNRGATAARAARREFRDAYDALVDFQSAQARFAHVSAQQAFATGTAAQEEANRIAEAYQKLRRERDRLQARASLSGAELEAGVLPLTPTEQARLAELPGLMEATRTEWSEIARVATDARDAVVRYNAEARVAALATRFGIPEEETPQPDPLPVPTAAPDGRSIAEVLADLRQAQAVTQALFELGVIGPAAAAEEAAANLREALTDALRVTGGETTDAVRALSDELIRAREAVRALADEEEARENVRRTAAEFTAQIPRLELPEPPDWFAVLGVDGLRDAVEGGVIRSLRQAQSVYQSLQAAYDAATTQTARDEIRALMEQVEALIGAMEGGITVAERYGFALANAVGQAAGQGVFDFLIGPDISEAQRQLREFEFGLDGEALREQFAEGSIGAEEFRLRMEALREEQAAFAAQFDPLKRAANGFFDAMKRGIADMIADLVRATATALVLKYVLGPLLGVKTGGFGAILGGLLGISGGAGKNGAAGAAPAAVQARELATAQAQGGTIVFRPEVGEFRVSNGYLLASVRAALAEERRSGRGSGAL